MFASLVAIGSAAVFSLPFLLPTAFVFSPLVGVIAAYGYLKSRSPQQKLLQGPSSSAGRRPWQPSPGVPGRHLQEKQAALLPQPASTSMDVQRIPRVTRASETAAGGERNEESGPGSRAGGFGETQARERTNLDAARRFPPPQLAYPLPAPFQAAPPQAAPPQAAPSQAAPPQAAPPQAAPQLAAPHVAPTPPAGIRARPSSPESVHVAGYPKARAVAGLGSLEGPAEAVRPTMRMRVQAIDSAGAEEELAGGRGTRVGGLEGVEEQRQERAEEEGEEEEEEGPTLVLHHIPKELTGAARVRGVEAGKTGEIGGAEEAGKTGATGGAGGEVPEEAAAAGVAGQEGGKPEAEVEEKRVVDVQGGEGSEEDQLLMEKEVHEEGVRVASEIKKLEKVLAGRTIQSPGSPREEAELLCGLLGVTPPPPLSPQPRFPRQARASRKQTVEGQLWEVRRASQLVEATKEELGVA
ncbi:unnamed protein product [Closterium sp. NIES-65]|nr:unnamed protein product [Closterium sp. NIES-65]